MLVSGCVVEPNGQVAFAPVVVAPAPVYYAPPPAYVPAPQVEYAPDVTVMVPDAYVWDGYENVGIVGGVYFYLGPGNIWLRADPFRIDRFHGWERSHPDWHAHAIRNDRFRTDAHGHFQPLRDDRNRQSDKTAPDKKKKDEDHGDQ